MRSAAWPKSYKFATAHAFETLLAEGYRIQGWQIHKLNMGELTTTQLLNIFNKVTKRTFLITQNLFTFFFLNLRNDWDREVIVKYVWN